MSIATATKTSPKINIFATDSPLRLILVKYVFHVYNIGELSYISRQEQTVLNLNEKMNRIPYVMPIL